MKIFKNGARKVGGLGGKRGGRSRIRELSDGGRDTQHSTR